MSKLTKIMEQTFAGETIATREKMDAARIAKDEGNNDAATFFERASADENRHRSGLQGFLNKMK